MRSNEAIAATQRIWNIVADTRTRENPFVGLVGFGPTLLENAPENAVRFGIWALHVSREKDEVGWTTRISTEVEAVLDRSPEDWEIVTVTTGLQLALASAVRPGSCLQRRVGNLPAGPASTAAAQVKFGASSRFILGSAHALAAYGQGGLGNEVHLSRPSPTGPADTFVGSLAEFSKIDFTGAASSFVDGALVELVASCTPQGEALCFGRPFGSPADPAANEKVAKCGAVPPFQTQGKILVVGGNYEITFPIFVGGKLAKVWFQDQVSIVGTDPNAPFGSTGDSGALVVSDDGYLFPRALLMSGSELRNEFVANRISKVIDELHFTFP